MARLAEVVAAVVLAGLLPACDDDQTVWMGANFPTHCTVAPTAPPAALALDPSYTKYLDAAGIPVVGSALADDRALAQACLVVAHMVASRDDVRRAMVGNKVRVGVVAPTEKMTDMAEYRDLYTVFPGSDWNSFTGLGATVARPLVGCRQSNILCAADDTAPGEAVLVYSFGVSMPDLGIAPVDSGFRARLQAAYDAAMVAGRFAGTWAAGDAGRYWGEGVQAWFDANPIVSPPDGVHNQIGTRAALQAYDPTLAALIAEFLPAGNWRVHCP